MKYLYLYIGLIVIAGMSSCSKSGEVSPTSSKSNNTSVTTNVTVADTISTYHLLFNAPNQKVVTSVSGDTLKMTYTENICILISSKGYNLSYAIHLFQDFSNTSLNGVNFYTVNQNGQGTFNWVDDNLNNVKLKTIKDTTVNNMPLVNVHVVRPFQFYQIYTSSAAAVSAQTALLSKTNETMDFSSYVYFTITYPTYSTTAKLVYTK